MSASVLITGAAGFVGRYVAKEYAQQGYDVIGMGRRFFPDYADWGLSAWHEADVSIDRLREHAGEPDEIVHCAGGASVGDSVEHPRKDFCLTVDATSQVLEYMRLHSPNSKLIYPSSAAVYGQAKEVPIRESSILNPVSPYGVHKLMAESLCSMYADRYKLKISVVRLFSIYGVGLKKQLLWDACNKLANNETTFFGTGEEVRDWLHITDAAHLIRLASIQASTACPIINGGSGSGLKVKEVLALLRVLMEVDKDISFSAVYKDGDPNVLLAEPSKAHGCDWRPTVPWGKGVEEYVRWFR